MAILHDTLVIQGTFLDASELVQPIVTYTPSTLPPDIDWLVLGDWALKDVSESDTPVVMIRPATPVYASGNITLTGVSDPECCGCNVVLIG